MSTAPTNVINKKLYLKVKEETKKKFKVWPSAYASAYLVKEYKKRGGKYRDTDSGKVGGLNRWFEEQWIDVCYYPKIVPCGRSKGGYEKNVRAYPYCRPLKRVTKSSPKTVKQLSPSERKVRCSKKRKSPQRRIR